MTIGRNAGHFRTPLKVLLLVVLLDHGEIWISGACIFCTFCPIKKCIQVIKIIVLRQEVKSFLSLHINKKARARTGGGAKIWI